MGEALLVTLSLYFTRALRKCNLTALGLNVGMK